MSSKSPQKPAPKAKKTEVMNTGVKVDGKTVYFTKGLKNPLSGFFVKAADGKKTKVLAKNVTNEKSKSALENVLKKHSNVATPPAGKVLNPLTGRFVKAPTAKKEKKVAKKVPSSAWKFGSLLEFIAFVETDDLLYAMQNRDIQSLERDIDIKGYPNVQIHVSAHRGHNVKGGRSDNIIRDSVTITKGGVTKEFSRTGNVSMRAFIENPTG
jgi:hypothetical protein